MSIAAPVFLSLAGRKMVIVGFVTPVIHLAFFVGASEGARTRSGPIVPKSPGTVPGQTGSTSRASAPLTMPTERSPTNTPSQGASQIWTKIRVVGFISILSVSTRDHNPEPDQSRTSQAGDYRRVHGEMLRPCRLSVEQR